MDSQEFFFRFKLFVDAASNWIDTAIAPNVVALLKAIGVLFVDVLKFLADLIQSLVS
ncbi:MAG: hypothetical protein V3T98_01650 [Candidatus Paceibacterota bacterium]